MAIYGKENLLVNSAGQPVVIDPAVYYGDREVELAMPLLFGGFPIAFLTLTMKPGNWTRAGVSV